MSTRWRTSCEPATVAVKAAVFGLGEAGGIVATDLVTAGVEVHGYDPRSVPTPPGAIRHDDPVTAVQGVALVCAFTAASDRW